MMEARAVVVGAGFAGAATAYHLARRGLGPVVVLEREEMPGLHSSGRNAAMVRQVVADPWIADLAREGARAIRSVRSAEKRSIFQPNGSLLLAAGSRLAALQREAALARAAGLITERWSYAEAAARVPVLEGADFEEGCFCPSDGVVDIALLLEHYLSGAREDGARISFGADVREVLTQNGRVAGIVAGGLRIATPCIVNAAGAWAPELAARAGAAPIPLRALRRHLVFTGPFSRASKRWPFVWDVAHEIYFRPESDGILLSPCDETECAPGLPETDPAAVDLLHEKLEHIPGLNDLPVARAWAGLRIFAPDGRFVIGPDPKLPGFFWAAALGGHGVTTSDAVGSLAADLIEHPERDLGNPFSAGRFGR